jgi:hypothetical protein
MGFNSVFKGLNPLALELDMQIVAHHLCKMWIFYEPKKVTLWNTRHFVEEYNEIVQQVSKNIIKLICLLNI